MKLPFGKFASSTAIRSFIAQGQDYKNVLPYCSFEILEMNRKYGKIITDLSTFEKEILYTFRKMSITEIANLPDVSEGLENKIKSAANESNTAKDFINIVKSKRYTETRIQRIMLYALLSITKTTMLESKKNLSYIRVLGMTNKGKELISQIRAFNPKLPVITSVKDFINTNKNKFLSNMITTDLLATDLYTLGYEYEPYANLDYTKKIVIK